MGAGRRHTICLSAVRTRRIVDWTKERQSYMIGMYVDIGFRACRRASTFLGCYEELYNFPLPEPVDDAGWKDSVSSRPRQEGFLHVVRAALSRVPNRFG